MCKRVNNILALVHNQSQKIAAGPNVQNIWQFTFVQIMQIVLTKLFETSKSPTYETRCKNFFQGLPSVLKLLTLSDLGMLNAEVNQLLQQLPTDIIERPIKELGSNDQDTLLYGLMSTLAELLQRYPQFKQQVGGALTQYLVHDCLFEIPHGQKNAPKCKSISGR